MPKINISDEEYEKFDPDYKLTKDSPCNICGRKSTARLRQRIDDVLWVFGVCDDHFEEFEKVMELMKHV